ncbi:hypothetical protein [Arthrobacter sp. UYEF3]|uniref:hypothetical protein n=1 Tax=Arthrobacter sp. UYEF3 TaxID=1756365 RepID=UPI00339288A2
MVVDKIRTGLVERRRNNDTGSTTRIDLGEHVRLWDQMPHNPWPRGMAIRVDATPHHLAVLLFIRHAWGIAADADVPRLDPLPAVGGSAIPDTAPRAEWDARWRRAWVRAWDWYSVQEPDPTVHPTPGYIRAVSRPGQDLDPLIPPFWQADYGWEGIDPHAYNAWEQRCSPDAFAVPRRRAAASPEAQSLPALTAAWQGGVDSVIVLPYEGYFARRVTSRHLAVSAATRDDPGAYSRALRTAVGDGWPQ